LTGGVFCLSLYLFYMKIIITENKLDKAIYKYIDDMLGEVYMDKAMGENGPLEGAYDFYHDDYEGDYLFTWTSADYYNSKEYQKHRDERHQKLVDMSPIIELMPYPEKDFNNLFGNRWRPVFKQWFVDKFGLPVTTIHQ